MIDREIANFHINNQESLVKHLIKDNTYGSFLFVGQNGIGKKDFAFAISEEILNDRTRIAKEIHPDCLCIDNREEKILVDDINKLEEWTFSKPFEGNRKIGIIESAENMNTVAQNKLLKILEEPPDYLFFFLLSANSSMLLPTVESRCIKSIFQPLPNEIIKSSIENKFDNDEILNVALFVLNGSYDKDGMYNEEFFLNILEFVKIVILKEVSLIDRLINIIDILFKSKEKQYKIVNCIIRVLTLILRKKHNKNEKFFLQSINLDGVSSYSITKLINKLDYLNSNIKGTSLNLRVGLEELTLNNILRNEER